MLSNYNAIFNILVIESNQNLTRTGNEFFYFHEKQAFLNEQEVVEVAIDQWCVSLVMEFRSTESSTVSFIFHRSALQLHT